MGILDSDPGLITEGVRKGKHPIALVGLGHVGLPLALLLASEGARVTGCERPGPYFSNLKKGISPIIEHSGSRFAKVILAQTCPNCGVRLLDEHHEHFCPNCMRVVELTGGQTRVTGRTHRMKLRTKNVNEMQTLLHETLRRRRLSLTNDTAGAVSKSDVVVICVGTPIDSGKRPNLDALKSAAKNIGKGLRQGSLVVLKSTVSPGTTENMLAPILEKESGLSRGVDFGLAHVPETTLEGLALLGYRTLPKTVGGIDERSSRAAAAVFRVFEVPMYIFDSPKVTEAAKLFQNIYRDVNVALANELALASESLGLDVTKVIEAALTEPKTHLLTPGPGVGGYCLTKDSYYIIAPASDAGFSPRILSTARKVNDSMPSHVFRLVKDAFADEGKELGGSTIGVLGVSFKANTADTRDSPSLKVIEELLKAGASLRVHDPLADLESIPLLRGAMVRSKDLKRTLEGAVAAILLTDHLEYRALNSTALAKLAPSLRIVVDSRHVFDPLEIIRQGYVYRGVGRAVSIPNRRVR
jgi:nucleotide sugar dehydrogenase